MAAPFTASSSKYYAVKRKPGSPKTAKGKKKALLSRLKGY